MTHLTGLRLVRRGARCGKVALSDTGAPSSRTSGFEQREPVMPEFDLVIRGGTVVTAADTYRADVGVRDGRIAAVGERLGGTDTLDAGGLYVMPGGVDTHCHIEQLRPHGGTDEESFSTGS